MLKGIDVTQRIEFSSKEDKGTPKTIFVFKPLSGIEMMNVGKDGVEGLFNMLKTSIVEIKNFKGLTDKDEILSRLPMSVLSELLEEATKINNLLEKDVKN